MPSSGCYDYEYIFEYIIYVHIYAHAQYKHALPSIIFERHLLNHPFTDQSPRPRSCNCLSSMNYKKLQQEPDKKTGPGDRRFGGFTKLQRQLMWIEFCLLGVLNDG